MHDKSITFCNNVNTTVKWKSISKNRIHYRRPYKHKHGFTVVSYMIVIIL